MRYRIFNLANLTLLVVLSVLICFWPRINKLSDPLIFKAWVFNSSRPLNTSDLESFGKSDKPVLRSDSNITQDNISHQPVPVKQSVEPIKTEKPFPCDDITPVSQYRSRGQYYVLYNYIIAAKSFKCHESITYTTNADFSFLDNVIPIVTRWGGPISLSVYSPGTDFMETLRRIFYLRECVPESQLVRDYVTFHIFFDRSHTPQRVINFESLNSTMNCSVLTSALFGNDVVSYKKSLNLTYPINVGRNIARDMATTHYVFASDIELYPSPNLIQKFLEMVQRDIFLTKSTDLEVFVLSVFEIEKSARIPTSKKDLVQMLKNQSAVPFHHNVCSYCHKIPQAKEWTEDKDDGEDLNVFHSAKRTGLYSRWEPFYIGTKRDPEFDERLSWEGKGNKMTQDYLMCVQDYDFLILDNAFLIHRPGIKTAADIRRPPQEKIQSKFIWDVILKEYNAVYGTRKGCVIL